MRAPGLAVVLLGFAQATTQAAAAPLETAGATQCEARGWVKDKDPKGTNIRNGPRWSFAPCSAQLTTCDGWRMED